MARERSQMRELTEEARERIRSGKGPRVGHLDSLSCIHSEMIAVYKEARYEMLDSKEAARFFFMLKTMKDTCIARIWEDLMRRVAALENPSDVSRILEQIPMLEPPEQMQ